MPLCQTFASIKVLPKPAASVASMVVTPLLRSSANRFTLICICILIPYPVGGHRSVQVSSSQASPEDKNQQQHCKSDNNMYKDSTIIHGKFGIAFKENEVNNEETNVLDELEDVMKQKSQVEAVKSEERTLLLSDLPSSAKAGTVLYLMLSTNHFFNSYCVAS